MTYIPRESMAGILADVSNKLMGELDGDGWNRSGAIGSMASMSYWILTQSHAEQIIGREIFKLLNQQGNAVMASLLDARGAWQSFRLQVCDDVYRGEDLQIISSVERRAPEKVYMYQPQSELHYQRPAPASPAPKKSGIPSDYLYCEWCGGYTKSGNTIGECAACGHIRTKASFEHLEATK